MLLPNRTLLIFLLLTFAVSGLFSQDNLTSTQRTVDYPINDSVDTHGNLYIKAWSQLPSVLTFVNNDGSISVCTSSGGYARSNDGSVTILLSGENTNKTYVFEHTADLKELRTMSFENEFDQLGAFTKDSEGNYYFFYAQYSSDKNKESMALVKYDKTGEKLKTYTLKANAPRSFGGINEPFYGGTCRMELSGSMLAVYFGRKMFNGHQASYGFILDKDTFEKLDQGQVTDKGSTYTGKNRMPYVSHSFNQFILSEDGCFIFADHGDAYPRCFTFAKYQDDRYTREKNAFPFAGTHGQNATYAEMGALAKTSAGYIFCGTYGREKNKSRNLFVITIGENMDSCSTPIYLTEYTRESGHAGHPKIVGLGSDHYLLLWEQFQFSTQSANSIEYGTTGYLATYMLQVNEKGEVVSEPTEIKARLNMNDVLRYNPHNGKVYWAINDSSTSITIYALDVK